MSGYSTRGLFSVCEVQNGFKGLADWPPDVSNSLRLGNACIITGYLFWQWGFQEVLEYLTGARAVDIHSQVVDHDPGFLVGFFDGACFRVCELFGVLVVEDKPIRILELVHKVGFRVSCNAWARAVLKLFQRSGIVPEKKGLVEKADIPEQCDCPRSCRKS